MECKLTVLMPAYNASLYVQQAIDSVLKQTFNEFEFLIIDDGSTDGTSSIIEAYEDKRIKLLRMPHRGISKTLNSGLQMAKGEYIVRFDADDVCMPDRLEKQIAFLDKNPEYVLVGSDIDYLNSKGQHVFTYRNAAYSDSEIKQLPLDICPFIHSSVCYKKEAVLKAGGYDENAHSFEDHLLWRKLLPFGKVCNLSEVLIRARFSPESLTIDERWRGKRFMQIKLASLQRGVTSKEEGVELLSIIRKQNTNAIKYGSYYALMGKKYLWNNYNPRLARKNFIQCWRQTPQLSVMLLWFASFLPKPVLGLLYKSVKRATTNQKAFQ